MAAAVEAVDWTDVSAAAAAGDTFVVGSFGVA